MQRISARCRLSVSASDPGRKTARGRGKLRGWPPLVLSLVRNPRHAPTGAFIRLLTRTGSIPAGTRHEVVILLELLTMARWSPYIAGAGIGILTCLAFLLSDRPLGCSTAFVKARGLIGRAINADKTGTMAYYREIVPQVDWAFMIIPGIIAGACISAVLSGTFRVIVVPQLWDSAFGNNPVIRLGVALAGGILLGLGARWAGGCTSGHGISGSIQLSLASMITAACFFAGGIAVAMLLYHGIGGW
jgi:uncharacterized protein